MVWACTTASRGRLCQTDLGGKCRWTTEHRKTEKEMDRRRQVQMEDLQLNVEDAEHRAEWRRRTSVTDPLPKGSTA